MLLAEEAVSSAPNHPRAALMAAIAFLNLNIVLACMWGSFSVVLGAVQTRLGISGELATLSVPAISISTAIFAPIVGALATRYSLRLVMLAGSLFSVAGYVLLAFSASFPLYLMAYALLLGPGMAAGLVVPGTLVTRWFSSGRGKALGIISTPLVISFIPLIATWVLQSHGLPAVYLALTAISLISVIANFFIQDFPPATPLRGQAMAAGNDGQANGGVTMGGLLRSARFWALVLAYAAGSMGAIMFSSHLVPIAKSWGFSATLAATLLTIQSLTGILGSNLFGWLGDRLGGALTMTVLLFDAALLWLLMLLHPPFIGLAIIVALLGVHAAGLTPAISLAISQVFGRQSFARGYGLANLITTPFTAVCVPGAAIIFARTGSYTDVIIGQAALMGLTALLAFTVGRRAR